MLNGVLINRTKQVSVLGICVVIALAIVAWCGNSCWAVKYPTFQVRGGSVFTYGDDESNGVQTMGPTYIGIGDKGYVFSSWVEYGAFSNGYMDNGFASGAATGFGFESGSEERYNSLNYCDKRAILSFANSIGGANGNIRDYCSSSNKNGKTGLFGYNYPRFNLKASIDSITVDDGVFVSSDGGGVVLPSGVSFLNDGVIDGHKVIIVKNGGNLMIEKDLKYKPDGVYGSFEGVPKLLIYVDGGNINISCDVGRVDAILFTSGDVNTCADGSLKEDGTPDYDKLEYSKQLVINGAIVAKNVNFQRTYGAVNEETTPAEGVDVSKCKASAENKRYCASTPAEIVNYDVSILATGVNAGGVESTANMVTVYQRELPPRY